MYAYDELDRTLVNERVSEFRDQVKRRLSGELTEDEFKMLRLQNGVYLQLHAYMFRVAIPYGTLSSKQLRALAHVARRYDRGYGHFTTRQNIQYNWIKLAELPDALADLAEVGIHAMQTSGNNMRNVTSDQWAGVAPGEIEDPRIWSEILRQYTTLHPEFSFLPRKFKIAITASEHDRAAIKIHDIGLQAASRTTTARPASRCWSAAGSAARRSSPRPSSRSCTAATSSAMSRRSCASTTSTAAATTSTRRASRSWCTSSASRSSPRKSRRSGSRCATAR